MPQPPQDDPSHAAVPPAVARARDVPTLLEALVDADPGRPRLTWYGAGGERVELSARVLVNWVAKTADLLANECDVEPGDVVSLALPPSWRATVIALAAWCVGAEPSWDGDEGEVLDDLEPQPPAVLVTTADGPVGPAGRVVVVDLPALSRSAAGGPPGALDYNAEVTGRDDVLAVDEQVQDRRVLELADDLARISEFRPGERVLGAAEDLDPDLVLGALRRDGSVVAVAADAGLDLDDLAAQEQATARA
ncbi:TIGR03089 family protein [Pseudokineococcus sp. 5B2Z-1]|uniref:TIGR03089 family protein n=1 Tax=Pseudokineococcus sp. 5B2Z-1 TaxID=3132744 RepID=UPI0030B564D0